MEPYIDATGMAWEIIDFKGDILNGKKRRVALGARDADGRAFRPLGRDGEVRVYEFGKIARRSMRSCGNSMVVSGTPIAGSGRLSGSIYR